MALPILDGNQSATTLSTILSGGEHTPAHTVVSLGSTAISNITSAVSGSVVSVSNFPSTQTIAGTVTANVFGYDSVNDENRNIPVCEPNDLVIQSFIVPVGIRSGTVTVGNSVTISSLPSISGTVTIGGFSTVSVGSGGILVSGVRGGLPSPINLDTSDGKILSRAVAQYSSGGGFVDVSTSNALPVSQQGAISGTVTANLSASLIDPREDYGVATEKLAVQLYDQGGSALGANGSLPISGTVTVGAVPNGSLTTRFGTPTTASVAFATSAVTNANRKYLLVQNVTTGGNVITVGIGFTPTTTQGIQLAVGAGITFESSYIPTGAVYVLSSVTASNFTILEA